MLSLNKSSNFLLKIKIDVNMIILENLAIILYQLFGINRVTKLIFEFSKLKTILFKKIFLG